MPFRILTAFLVLLASTASADPPAGLEARSILAEALKDGTPDTDEVLALTEKHPNLFQILPKTAETDSPEADSKIFESIAYLRPNSLDREASTAAAEKLQEFTEAGATTLIIDLRIPTRDGSVRDTLAWMNLFLPKGEQAFRILGSEGKQAPTRSRSEPLWQGEIAILVDSDTGSLGEVLTYALANKEKPPLVFGAPTKGRAAFYSNIHLDDGRIIQFATAHLLGRNDEPLLGEKIKILSNF